MFQSRDLRHLNVINCSHFYEGVDRGGWGSGIEGAESGVEGAESGVEGAGRGAIVGGGLEKLGGEIAFFTRKSIKNDS